MTIVDSSGPFRFRHSSFIETQFGSSNSSSSSFYMREKLLPRRAMTIYHHRNEKSMNDDDDDTSPTIASSPPPSAKKIFSSTLRRALSASSNHSSGSSSTTGGSHQQRSRSRLSMPVMADPYHQPLAYVASTQQDMVLRSLAAIAIERHVSPYFTTDELLHLAEHQKQHKNKLWNKVKLHFRSTTSTSSNKPPHPLSSLPPPPTPLSMLVPPETYISSIRSSTPSSSSRRMTATTRKRFGVPLVTVVLAQRHYHPLVNDNSSRRAAAFSHLNTHHPMMAAYFSPHAMVPSVVQNCILALLQEDLKIEGIFRKNGNIRQLTALTQRIDNDQPYFDDLVGPIQVAALLKRFLRDLPEPVLPHYLAKLFLTSLRMQSLPETKAVLHLACCMLPKHNRDLMQLLCLFMNHVASFQDHNMMNAQNLATILTPNFLSGSHGMEATTADEIQVVQLLISHQPEFVMVPDAFANLMHDTSVTKSLYSNTSSSSSFRRSYINLLKLGAYDSSPSSSSSRTQSAVMLSNDSHTQE